MKKDFKEIEKAINIQFNDEKLLQQVFVHRSYLNENNDLGLEHNERLEFLGDAVLELAVTEYLYKNFQKPEGELTNLRSALVRGEALSQISNAITIDDYLYLSRGEAKSGGKARQIILANALEALIGAIYLDQGYEKAEQFVREYVITNLSEIMKKGLHVDAKSKLQEVIQDREGITPVYRMLAETGPDHAKHFTVGVFVGERMIGEGTGASKQTAEQDAAQTAMKYW